MLYYYCRLPNEKKPGPFPQLITDNQELAETFVSKHDIAGYGVYRSVNPLLPGATRRCRETVGYVVCLHVDIDLKHLVAAPEEVEERLLQLPLQPTVVRRSGGGFHFIYELREPVDVDDAEYVSRVEALLKRLTLALSGDPAPAHIAALLRMEGTHNSKYPGGAVLVEAVWGSGEPVDITDIETLCDLLPEEGIFERKANGNGHDKDATVIYPDQWRPPVDVEQRFASMQWHGGSNSGINITQRDTVASLLGQGVALYEATNMVVDATKQCAAGDPKAASWNWQAEWLDVAYSGARLINKDHKLVDRLPDDLREKFEAYAAEGRCPVLKKNPHKIFVYPTRSKSEAPEKGPEPEAPPHKKYRFKLVPFSDLRPGPEPLYLVDELIPIAGLVDVWGKAKCFKSFWCLDLMLHVAMGWEYRDRYVQQGAVVYFAFEGGHGYKKRVEALRRHYNIAADTNPPLYVVSGQANLVADHRTIIAEIGEQLGDTQPAAVVLDTLNKSLVGSENKDIDMGNYVRAAEAIRNRFGCVVIIVHHCGYDDTRPRGHSSLPGAVDAQLAVTRTENIITVTVEMMRDGPEDTQVVSEATTVEVGQDQNGKTLTSLVIVPSEADPAGAHQGWPRGLSVFEAALKAALVSHGEDFQPEAGTLPVRAVTQTMVRDRFYKTYADAEEDEKKRQEKIRKAFNRSLADAQSRGLVRAHTDKGKTMLWRPVPGDHY